MVNFQIPTIFENLYKNWDLNNGQLSIIQIILDVNYAFNTILKILIY